MQNRLIISEEVDITGKREINITLNTLVKWVLHNMKPLDRQQSLNEIETHFGPDIFFNFAFFRCTKKDKIAFNELRRWEENSCTNSSREPSLRTVSTLGNPISNLTKSSFLLDWREQAWPLTCSVIKAKQTPSISCHYRREEGEEEEGERKG